MENAAADRLSSNGSSGVPSPTVAAIHSSTSSGALIQWALQQESTPAERSELLRQVSRLHAADAALARQTYQRRLVGGLTLTIGAALVAIVGLSLFLPLVEMLLWVAEGRSV